LRGIEVNVSAQRSLRAIKPIMSVLRVFAGAFALAQPEAEVSLELSQVWGKLA